MGSQSKMHFHIRGGGFHVKVHVNRPRFHFHSQSKMHFHIPGGSFHVKAHMNRPRFHFHSQPRMHYQNRRVHFHVKVHKKMAGVVTIHGHSGQKSTSHANAWVGWLVAVL